MRIIGIDVDNVLFDAGLDWYEWAVKQFGITPELHNLFLVDHANGNAEFSFGKYFPEVRMNDLLDFWRMPGIYDKVSIDVEAKEVINKLIEDGYDVIFVSHVMGDHGFSKEKLLIRNFGPKVKHIFTQHKNYVRLDVIIDDRLKNLAGFPPETKLVHFKTQYYEDGSLVQAYPNLHSNDWNVINRYVRNCG